MTADERIEKLLNRFGQTISDLPKSADNDWSTHVYESRHLISAKKAALVFMVDEWQDADGVPEIRYEVEEVLLDYICHLADVIDRMEVALETATRMTDCGTCEHCNARYNDFDDSKCGCGDFPECDYCIDERHMHDVDNQIHDVEAGWNEISGTGESTIDVYKGNKKVGHYEVAKKWVVDTK